MKYFFIFILLSLFGFSRTIDCMVPREIIKKVQPLFKETILYNKLKVNVKATQDDKEALRYLVDETKAKFAIVRRDVLWQIDQNKSALKDSYILISELPFEAMLYLVQGVDSFDMDLDSLEKKKVSVGNLGEANNFYLKALLKKSRIRNTVLYKSIGYKKTIQALKKEKIDAYFGFLLPCKESNDLHFQTLFSEETEAYFKNMRIFNVDYNGIASPYVLVAAALADDEEIESMMYRLMEKELFVPVTYKGFGPINRYVLNHLEQVKIVLKSTYEKNKNNEEQSRQVDVLSKVCRKYHYGFLKLLRQKPAWKKKLKRLGDPKRRTKLIKAFNRILLDLEAKKEQCDLTFLKVQKMKLQRLKGK